MKYPVENPKDWLLAGRLSPARRLFLPARNWKYGRRSRQWGPVSLAPVRTLEAAPAPDCMVLLCVARNAARGLPSFLHHYRGLGIHRFAFVDDQSEDATQDILLGAPDVDLFRSDAGFRESDGGKIWRDLLVDRYGRDRWYVSVDSDEYLVFPGFEERPLASFVEDLNRHGLKRALGVMLDIYPDAPLDQTPPHLPPERFPAEICPLFDGDGYRLETENFCMAVRGGPRFRRFGTDMRLTKFPVLFADAATRFSGGSHHGPLPIERNYSPVHAILLHYKFSVETVAEFKSIVGRGSYAGGSHFYRMIVDHESFRADTDLRYAGSRRYSGSEALVMDGFMQDLRGRSQP